MNNYKDSIPYFRTDFFDKNLKGTLSTLVVIKSKNDLFPYDDILEMVYNYDFGDIHVTNEKNDVLSEDSIKFNNYNIFKLDTSLEDLDKCFSSKNFKNVKKFLTELRANKISENLIISNLSEVNEIKFKIAISKDYSTSLQNYFSDFQIKEKDIYLPERKIIRISSNLPSLDGRIEKEKFKLLNRGSTSNYRDYFCENVDGFISSLDHLCNQHNKFLASLDDAEGEKEWEYKIKDTTKTPEIEKQFLIAEKKIKINEIEDINVYKSKMESKLAKFAEDTLNQFLAQLEYGHYCCLLKNKRKSKNDNYIGRGLEISNYKIGYREDLNKTFRSSWEANYARILEYKKESYQFEPKRFTFKMNGNEINYLPDFKVGDKWIEVKGRFQDEDLEKIYAFKQNVDEKLEVVGPIKYYDLYNKYKDKIKFEHSSSITPSIKTKVVGIKFNNRVDKIKKLKSDSSLKLKRDYNNKYDKNAIEVLNDDNETLGFIPKELAIILAPRMDNGEKFKVYIDSILNNSNFNSLKVEIKK